MLEHIEVSVVCKAGRKTVPGVTNSLAKGLAVTMVNFGYFNVSHIGTGRNISCTNERAADAILNLSKLSLIALDNGFCWEDLDQESTIKTFREIGEKPVPFEGAVSISSEGERRLTINEWMRSNRMYSAESLFGEYPWEEEHPLDKAELIFEQCAKVCL